MHLLTFQLNRVPQIGISVKVGDRVAGAPAHLPVSLVSGYLCPGRTEPDPGGFCCSRSGLQVPRFLAPELMSDVCHVERNVRLGYLPGCANPEQVVVGSEVRSASLKWSQVLIPALGSSTSGKYPIWGADGAGEGVSSQ